MSQIELTVLSIIGAALRHPVICGLALALGGSIQALAARQPSPSDRRVTALARFGGLALGLGVSVVRFGYGAEPDDLRPLHVGVPIAFVGLVAGLAWYAGVAIVAATLGLLRIFFRGKETPL